MGGVPEVVRDGENGLLVAPGDPVALADAIGRFFGDDALRAQLSEAAAAIGGGPTSEEAVFTTIEAELRRAVA